MKIKTKVTFKEYVKLLYGLTYQRPIMKVIVGIAVLILLWIIFYYLHIFNLPEPVIYQYITLALIVVFQPIGIFVTIRRVYHSSNQISEPLEMDITDNEIKIQGSSFYLEVKWEKLFKIVEKRNWFLLYQNNLSAILIPKKQLSKTEINTLKGILKEVKVPVKLIEE